MSRTTVAAVRKIAKVKASLSDSDLAPFLDTATYLVDQCCVHVVPAPLVVYTDSQLELIERWLAAHCYSVFDPRRVEERADVISATYEGKTGMGLNFTRYGQMAMRLDTNGGLAALEAKQTSALARRIQAKLVWLGKVCDRRECELF